MAYIINNNDGTTLANVANGDVDSNTTSLDLIGKNVDNYGQYFNNNLVRLLTNFSYNQEPRSPQIGQLWFNTSIKRLTVYDGVSFKPTYGATVSGTPSITTSTGDIWYDTINGQMKIWNGLAYKLIGPPVSVLYGKFGVDLPYNTIRDDDTKVTQKIGVIYSNGNPIALMSTSTFSLSAKDGNSYLNYNSTSSIVNGITVAGSVDVRGSFYINSNYQMSSNRVLTAGIDITAYGDPTDPDVPTAITNIEAGNIAISQFLSLIFTTATNNTYQDIGYPIGSDARVVCYYSSQSPTVRRFHLIYDPLHPNIKMWRWWDLYYSNALSTFTNIVVN